MVARALVLTWSLVDDAGLGHWFERMADKDVVNAQPAIATKAHVAVIPPRKTLGWLLEQAEAVVQPQRNQRA